MFSQILDCPTCGERFRYECGDEFPESISCPKCGKSRPIGDFSALVLCRQCRTKLSIPLDILSDPDLSCPQCGAAIRVGDGDLPAVDGDDFSTFDDGGADRRQLFKRMLQDGDIFDKYRIIRLLGRGGMADVYLAEHLLLKQPCALKLMRSGSESGDPIYVKRFIREAKLAHQFNHPNIVKVYDAGSDFKTGYLFIAMEYVEGKTLLELLKDGEITEEVLTEVLASMTRALKVLHDANVVHRDIKPSNIMRTADGVYKLMDLGIAKSDSGQQGEMTLTMDQAAIGTPGYASPEQCRSAHQVDTRSDIYCLGATLYHLASGVPPFTGNTPLEIIIKVLQTDTVPLKKLRPDLSPRMLGIIDRMMKKDPDERPENPEALEDMLAGRRRSGLRERLEPVRRFFRSRRYWLLILAVLLLAAGIYPLVRLARKTGGAPPSEHPRSETAPRGGTPHSEHPRSETGNEPVRRDAGTSKLPNGWIAPPPGRGWYARYEDAQARTAPNSRVLVLWIASNAYMRGTFPFVRKFERSNDFILRHFIPVYLIAPRHQHVLYQNQMFQELSTRINIPAEQLAYNCQTLYNLGFPSIPLAQCPGMMAIFDSNGNMKLLKPIPTSEAAFLAELQKFQSRPDSSATTRPSKKKVARDIDARLRECEKRLEELTRTPASPRRDEALEFCRRQIAELTRQRALKRLSEEARRKKYSVEATGYCKELADHFVININRRGTYRSSSEAARSNLFRLLLEKLSDPEVDPNLVVFSPTGDMPLFEAAMRIPPLLKVLKDRHVDVNVDITGKNLYSCYEIFFMGRDDVDSGAPLLEFIALTQYSRHGIGNVYDSKKAREFMLLAPRLDITDRDGRTLMHIAAAHDDAALVRQLVIAGYNTPEAKDAAGLSPWRTALLHGSTNALKALRECGFSTSSSPEDQLQYRFWTSLFDRKYDECEKLLAGGADPYRTNFNDLNAMQLACLNNDMKMVKLLLARKVDPNKFIPKNKSPGEIAVINGNEEMLELLLRHGLSTDLPNNPGGLQEFILQFALYQSNDIAVSCRMIEMLIKREKKLRCKPNFTEACWKADRDAKYLPFVKLLLEHGADPSLMSGDAKTLKSPELRKLLQDFSGNRPSAK